MEEVGYRDYSTKSFPEVENSTSESPKPESIKAIQGETSATSDWKDHGIIDVPVEELPMPENVTNPNDFDHHITWQDASKQYLCD